MPRRRSTARPRPWSTTGSACSPASRTSFEAGRYHSLIVAEEGLPNDLVVSARTRGDQLIMGLRHRQWPLHGVQFHPESVLTPEGRQLLRNFLAL